MTSNTSKTYTLYTIGYATKPLATFIQQLKDHNIEVIADVRSVPYSKVFHDYHRESITQHLRKNNIQYVYLGEELGPRSKDDSHYDSCGQVQFDRLMQSTIFHQGIQRLENGLEKSLSIALMCAEKDPATCHRSLLLGYFLERNNLSENNGKRIHIFLIGHDSQLEKQIDLEERLAKIHNIDTDLFMSAEEKLQQAYALQLKHTSYRKSE